MGGTDQGGLGTTLYLGNRGLKGLVHLMVHALPGVKAAQKGAY